MSKRKFFHCCYSPLFLVLATVFSSGLTVCHAEGIHVAKGGNYEVVSQDEAGWSGLSGNTITGSAARPGGAAIFNEGTIGMIGGKDMHGVISDNESSQGGAIYNAPEGRIGDIYADFESNISYRDGGAIYNHGTITSINGDFRENTATEYGGAIYNTGSHNGEKSYIGAITGRFIGNQVTLDDSRGGALMNAGEIGSVTGAAFSDNQSGFDGGAIFNEDRSIIGSISGNTFSSNTARSWTGGAIYNNGTIETLTGNAFDENRSSGIDFGDGGSGDGGAISNEKKGSVGDMSGNRFTGNEAEDSGGAIYNTGALERLSGNEFTGNAASEGGAIYSGKFGKKGHIHSTENNEFTSNKAKHGGAISNIAILKNLSGNTFTGNIAEENGGAIYNRDSGNSSEFGGAMRMGTIDSAGENTFTGNRAKNGGAIYNAGGTLNRLSGNIFTGNTAGEAGGAIYNGKSGSGRKGVITFSGTNTFSGNTAGGSPNDITNEGTLNFGAAGQEHEKTTIGSGIDGSGEMKLNSGELEIAGGRTVEQGTASFAERTNVLVTVSDSNVVRDSHAASASEIENPDSWKNRSIIHTTGGLTIENGAKLTVTGANANKTYLIAVDEGGSVQNAGDGWKSGNLIDSSNVLLDFSRVEGDTEEGTVMVTSSARKAEEALPCVDIPDNLDALSSGEKIDVNSAAAGIRFLSRATDSRYLPGGRRQMEEIINSAAQIGTAGAVKNLTHSGTGMFNRAIEKHLSLSRTLQQGDNIRLHEKEHTDLWVDLIGMHQRNHGMAACSGKECGDRTRFGHRIDMGGIIGGIDRSFDANRHAGIALMAGTGSASSKGNISHTKNDTDYWGLSLYGGYDRDNWNVMGNISYTHFDNDIDQSLPSSLQMGNKLRADVSSHQWSVGMRGEYRIRFENGIDLLPHAGLRYDRLVASGFRTEADAGSVFSTKKDTMNIYSLPVGAGVQGAFRNRNGWTFRPQADLSAIFATGDIRDRTEVMAEGLKAADSIRTRIVDRTSIMAGVGFDMQKENKSFGLHYEAMYSSRQMWQGLMAKIVYAFE